MPPQTASYLFAPATRLDRVLKAAAGAAGAVIVDLEDAVAVDTKDAARDGLADLQPPRPLLVRVNARSTPFHDDDIAAARALPWLAGVVVPKVEAGDDVAAVAAALSRPVPILAIVESARGIQRVDRIAAAGVDRLLFGTVDYLADIRATDGAAAGAYPRSRLVVASAAAGIASPVDGPTLVFDDAGIVAADAHAARAAGFGGKLCIHPAQVPVVNEAFAPTAAELAWATRVVEEEARTGEGVFTIDGKMVDVPVIAEARRLLGLA